MKKLKKSIVNSKINLKQEVKSSRVTIDSRICNIDKFNEFFALVDNTKDYKNTISKYCHEQLLHLVSNHKTFVSHYKLFNNSHLNSWEKQTLFQECSVCHYISSNNRKTQEEFICKNPQCKHKENADLNSPKVIKSRLLNNNLRYKLGKDNVYLCNRNNITNYKRVKSIVVAEYNIGVVTELLPRAKTLAKTKEAPSFMAE
jgi:hypothetical protein